jgi:hypothetical protein
MGVPVRLADHPLGIAPLALQVELILLMGLLLTPLMQRSQLAGSDFAWELKRLDGFNPAALGRFIVKRINPKSGTKCPAHLWSESESRFGFATSLSASFAIRRSPNDLRPARDSHDRVLLLAISKSYT